jgi:hypothetical protein
LLLRRVAALGTGLVALASCSPSSSTSDAGDAGGEPCPTGFLGSDAAAPQFDLQVLSADGTVSPLVDGGTVPIIAPPQGGRVLFIGVHATNVDGCGLQLQGAVRDLATNKVQVDSRTINLVPTGDGWGVSGLFGAGYAPDISTFSNVQVCPNEWSMTNIYGTTYGLEVTVTDRGGRTLTQKIHVTPECGEPASLAQCTCICMGGYVLGQACGDGGTDQ